MMQQQTVNFCSTVVWLVLVMSTTVLARPDASVKFSTIRAENPRQQQNSLVLPYAFSGDSMGTTFGIGGGMKGYGQDQLLVAGTAWASLDDAYGGIIGLWDYQLSFANRLFFSAVGSLGQFPRQRAYVSAPRPVGAIYAGSNDSDMDDYFEDSGTDNWLDFKLEYVVPIGGGADNPMASYHLKGGLLQRGAVGGGKWNPLESGITVLMLKQFNRYQSFDLPFGKQNYSTHPLKLGLLYNNTDFPSNPSSGSSQYIAYTKDFSWGEYAEEWDFLEFEASKYFDLGAGGITKQQVLALNFWTGHSPSYTTYVDEEGMVQVTDDPPFTQGAKLGGMYRMRAYPANRFNDRSVIYASAEYRWMPKWNPLGEISWLRFFNIDWMQLVPFVEVGRVADDYDLGELFTDLKVDGGISFRTLMAGAVIRLDTAASEEGSTVWIMFGHSF
jgi:hypothetical protein